MEEIGEMKKYKIILTEEGKRLFKGRNKKPISVPLITFKANCLKEAIKVFVEEMHKFSFLQMSYYALIEIR
ncbi:hypothetical protein GF336_00270 [Candidatus Woesearchaeota archaeon]|nr:hypothetical protein [Candidatus Woesearchaeota archaeon]